MKISPYLNGLICSIDYLEKLIDENSSFYNLKIISLLKDFCILLLILKLSIIFIDYFSSSKRAFNCIKKK